MSGEQTGTGSEGAVSGGYPDVDEFRERVERKYPGLVLPPVQDRAYETAEAASRSVLTEWLTPIEDHFVCHRFATPEVEGVGEDWEIAITGTVDEERSVSVRALVDDYPTDDVVHTMECAGNGRAGFAETDGSVLWGCTAVGNAVWTGTPLSAVLDDVGPADGDDLWLTAIAVDAPPGEGAFARSVPLSKVLDDCILAYAMNGRTLPVEHGYPVRLVVPGWYGVNNVKWIGELRVMEGMMYGEAWADRFGYQQQQYRIYPRSVEEPERLPTVPTHSTHEMLESDDVEHAYVFDLLVKSAIGYPEGEVVPREDGSIEVLGAAWAGDDRVETVEVSTDGGETWADAEFLGPGSDGSWRPFRHRWDADPGEHTLLSRATDERGRRQPATVSDPDAERTTIEDDEFPWNPRGYCNATVESGAVEVTVLARE